MKSPLLGGFLECNLTFLLKSPLFDAKFELNLTQKSELKIEPWCCIHADTVDLNRVEQNYIVAIAKTGKRGYFLSLNQSHVGRCLIPTILKIELTVNSVVKYHYFAYLPIISFIHLQKGSIIY